MCVCVLAVFEFKCFVAKVLKMVTKSAVRDSMSVELIVMEKANGAKTHELQNKMTRYNSYVFVMAEVKFNCIIAKVLKMMGKGAVQGRMSAVWESIGIQKYILKRE